MREVEKRVDGMRKNKDKADDLREAEEPARVLDGPARRTACRKIFASTRA